MKTLCCKRRRTTLRPNDGSSRTSRMRQTPGCAGWQDNEEPKELRNPPRGKIRRVGWERVSSDQLWYSGTITGFPHFRSRLSQPSLGTMRTEFLRTVARYRTFIRRVLASTRLPGDNSHIGFRGYPACLPPLDSYTSRVAYGGGPLRFPY